MVMNRNKLVFIALFPWVSGQKYCFVPGTCTEISGGQPTIDYTSCLEACEQNQDDCKYFTFLSTGDCIFFDSCSGGPDESLCTNCFTGKWKTLESNIYISKHFDFQVNHYVQNMIFAVFMVWSMVTYWVVQSMMQPRIHAWSYVNKQKGACGGLLTSVMTLVAFSKTLKVWMNLVFLVPVDKSPVNVMI